MRPPSVPELNTNDADKYFIYFNHDVPPPLRNKYKRKRIRIKIYDDINRFRGTDRDTYAAERLKVWNYILFDLKHNPFETELAELQKVVTEIETVKEEIAELEQQAAALTPEQERRRLPVGKLLDSWIESIEAKSIPTTAANYRITYHWLKAWFVHAGRIQDPICNITRNDIAQALLDRTAERKLQNTSFNNEKNRLNTFFNWLTEEGYIKENIISGKIKKRKTQKHKHRWFDKETKAAVIKELEDTKETLVLHVMQFTYELFIRSKTELMKLKAGDIDTTLKRVRYSADLSKNNVENYRDYTPEFGKLLEKMNFAAIPKNFYVFGKNGEPSEYKCHKDLFAERWRPVRDKLELSDDYTIYGMKHTRIVHEMMKGTDGRMISHMARHDDPKSTQDYMRDYDITLLNKYGPEDLKF